MQRKRSPNSRRVSRGLSFQSLENRQLMAGDVGDLTVIDTTISGNTIGVSPDVINDAPQLTRYIQTDTFRVR